MGLAQFLSTIHQIRQAEHVGFVPGVARHLAWEVRRVLRLFPVDLDLSQSKLHVERHSGQAALVNCMGLYDYHNMTLVCQTLRDFGGAFLDVGANIGVYTLVASETGNTVLAIEPHPRTFAMLRRNVEQNGRRNVRLLQLAISQEVQEVPFTDKQSSELNRIASDADAGERTIKVRSAPLDAVCEQQDVWPRVVKIDVEGFEDTVLASFERGLQRADLLLIENGTRPATQEFVHARGFRGPFYYSAGARTFLTRPQSRTEDPVFVREPAIALFQARGYQF